jgi:hypothetical protein
MEYDIFISYSHSDNENNNNWIHYFHQELLSQYISLTARKGEVIFIDKALKPGMILDSSINSKLDETLLFVPIISPSYLNSEWCRHEFIYFKNMIKVDSDSNNESRITPVKLYTLEYYEPEPQNKILVREVLNFLKAVNILHGDFFEGRPLNPTTVKFKNKVSDLARVFADRARKLRNKVSKKVQKEITLYLGITSFSVNSISHVMRDRLQKQINAQNKFGNISYRFTSGIEDIVEYTSPDDRTEQALTNFFKYQIDQSDYAVLLFDGTDDFRASDTKEPVSAIQYQVALNELKKRKNFRILVAISPHFKEQPLISKIQEDVKKYEGIILADSFEKNILLELLQRMSSEGAQQDLVGSTKSKNLFLIRDKHEHSDRFKDQIYDVISQNFTVMDPVYKVIIDNTREIFDRFYSLSSCVIILISNKSHVWFNSIEKDLIQLAGSNIKPMYILAADTDTIQYLERYREKNKLFQLIDCTHSGFEEQIGKFLNTSSHA